MLEAAREEPQGVSSCWVSLRAGNHSPSQDRTWRKVWKKEGHSEAYALKLHEITIISWVLSDNGDGNGQKGFQYPLPQLTTN